MDPIFNAITSLKKNLESLLENDLDKNHDEIDSIKQNFEVSRDPQVIRSLASNLPDDNIDRAIAIFSRLAYLFDAGIFLENHDGVYKAQAYFHNGIVEPIKINPRPTTRLPLVDLMTVLQTQPSPILDKLKLPIPLDVDDTKALLVKLTPEFSFVLFSKMPDLWLKDHLKQVLDALHMGIAE